jgi:hypothetical protein
VFGFSQVLSTRDYIPTIEATGWNRPIYLFERKPPNDP